VLQEIDRLATGRADFAFETTLSGLGYARRIRAWKRGGYRIEMVVPEAEIQPTCTETDRCSRALADAWAVYDNSGQEAQLLETSE
jgi:predicted ABC-type ATPase